MNRRKVLLGMGTAAAGAGAVFGSGAFTQVEAQRDLTIGVDDDSEALIGIKAGANVASVDEAESGDNEGELVIDTDKLSGDNDGFAVGSTVDIGDINGSGDVVDGGEAFSVTNNFDDVGDGTGDIDIALDLTGIDLGTVSGLSSLEFYGTGPNGTQVTSAGGRKVYDVSTDEVIDFAIRFKTASTTGPSDLDATVTFQAGSDLTSDDFPAAQPVDTVTRSSDGAEFSSIQGAVDDSDTTSGETLRVGAGTFDESVTIDVERLTLEAGENVSPTIAPGDNTDAIIVSANDVTVDGFTTEIGVTDGEATAVDLSSLSSSDSVTLEHNSFDADGEEGETYVFDPDNAVDLDAVEGANSFTGPAPVTGEVAINPNQPDAYDFENYAGESRIDRGGVAVEQTDGTLVILEPNTEKNYDKTQDRFSTDATLLYVSNDAGSVTLNAQARQQDQRAAAAYIYELDGKGDALPADEFSETLGDPNSTQIPETGTNYYAETYAIQKGQLVINWNTEPEVEP